MSSSYKSARDKYAYLAQVQMQTRRQFIGACTTGLGSLFLSSLGGPFSSAVAAEKSSAGRLDFRRSASDPLSTLPPQFAPKARRVIYLHMAGAPSLLELFDHKPE